VELQLLSSSESLAALAPEWLELLGRCFGYYLSQTFQWADATWRLVAQPAGRRLHCLVLRDGAGRLVAVWPLVARHEPGLTVIQPLGFEGSEYSQPLVDPGADVPACTEQMLRAAARLGDTIQLLHVRSDSALAGVLTHRRHLAAATDEQPAPYLARADYGDWNGLAKSLGKKFRYSLRRGLLNLKQRGAVEIGPVAPADLPAMVDWALDQKKAWLARTNERNDWIGRADYRAFLLEMLQRRDETGQVVMFALRVAGQPVAAMIVAVDATRVEFYFTVFDPAWAEGSPGNVLTEHVVAWAFERGLDFDFRIGDEAYKERWTNRSVSVTTWHVATGLRGVPAVARLRYGKLRFAAGRQWQVLKRRLSAAAGIAGAFVG
jgi:CelD/BcsL family acetyltransferase involved in cellulose biosynthesis